MSRRPYAAAAARVTAKPYATHLLLGAATALVVCLLLALPASADAAAGSIGRSVKSIAPQERAGKSVTFRVAGIRSARVRRGYIRAGRYHRRVRVAILRRAARRHDVARRKIAVSLPKRTVVRRRIVRLIVVLRTKPRRTESRSDAGTIEQLPVESEQTTDERTAETPVSDPASSGARATTRPVGSPILSDAEAAARVRRTGFEPRPANAAANQRTPRPGELDTFMNKNISVHRAHKPLVTGNFTGTTDEIIQWAAHKWGLDEDVLRAVVVKESWWRTSAVGDNGLSFGLTQIKVTYHAGTHPLSAASTAFNVDYYGALFRYYYEGHADWLDEMDKGQDYQPGDLWGAIGAHYAGRWHTDAAEGYIASVKRHLEQRTWLSKDFAR